MNLTGNWFCSREDLANLPYSVEEIYGIHTAGKYHDMKRVYNEFYHIYGNGDIKEEMKPDRVLVEDFEGNGENKI